MVVLNQFFPFYRIKIMENQIWWNISSIFDRVPFHLNACSKLTKKNWNSLHAPALEACWRKVNAQILALIIGLGLLNVFSILAVFSFKLFNNLLANAVDVINGKKPPEWCHSIFSSYIGEKKTSSQMLQYILQFARSHCAYNLKKEKSVC